MRVFRELPCFSQSHALESALLLVGCGMLFAPVTVRAQAVTYAGGKPSVNVGTATLCHPGATDSGCFVTKTLTYNVTATGTLGQPRVLTLGTGDLDFTLVSAGTTCQGPVTAGQTCTVAVKFAPRFVGGRRGGVRMVDSSGKTLTSTMVYGVGKGAQAAFDLNSPTLITNAGEPLIFDGAGDILHFGYVYGFGSGLEKLVPPYYNHTVPRPIGFSPGNLAIDGVGDVFGTDTTSGYGKYGVREIPAEGGNPFLLPFGYEDQYGVTYLAVDGAGDVFTALNAGGPELKELPAGSPIAKVISTAAFGTGPTDALTADAAETVYINTNSRLLLKTSGSGGPIVELGSLFPDTLGYSNFAVDGKGDIFVPRGMQMPEVLEYPAGTTTPIVFDLNTIPTGNPDTLIFQDVRSVYLDDGAANLYVENITYPATESIYKIQRNQGPALQFGTLAVTKTATATTRYYNDGDAPLTVTPAFNDLEFQLQSTAPAGCLTDLAPGQYCSLTVAYTPVKTGDQTATLKLKTNGAMDPVLQLKAHTVGVVTPVLSVPSGVYTMPQTVTVTAPTPGTQIFYTLDGTAPTAASTPYTGPITVSATATLEVVSIRGGVPSPTAVGLYTIAPGGTGAVNYAQGFKEGCTQGVYGGFQCAGSTYVNGKHLRLTGPLAYQAGIARETIPIARTGFTTNFTFQLTQAMADGFTFLLETDRPLAHGGSGKSLGYAGIADSMAVKFDLFGNEGEGPNSVGVYFDGAMPTMPAVSLAGSGIDLHSGHVMLAGITYNGSTLNLQLTDTISLASWTHAFPVDLSAHAGGPTATLFPGFTGGTGSTSAIQDVLSWSYVSGPPVAAAPVPQIPALPNFPDGISGQGMRLNGIAAINDQGALQVIDGKLNEAASAFYAKPVPITAFTTDFTFESLNTLADGFTLTIQNAGLDALGGRGLQLGYGGIPKSVALKFDFYNNAGEGNTSIGVFLNGATPTVPAVTYPDSTYEFLRYIGPTTAHVTYDGSVLTVALADSYGTSWTQTFPVDIPAAVGGKTAYIGFTGGAGTKSMTEQITRWTFSNP